MAKHKKNKKAKKLTEAQKRAIWMPMTHSFEEVMGKALKIDPIYSPAVSVYYGPADAGKAEAFESTQASQWSTASVRPKNKQIASPFAVEHDHRGKLTGIRWDQKVAREQIDLLKWFAKNPKLARIQFGQVIRRETALRDSALFL